MLLRPDDDHPPEMDGSDPVQLVGNALLDTVLQIVDRGAQPLLVGAPLTRNGPCLMGARTAISDTWPTHFEPAQFKLS